MILYDMIVVVVSPDFAFIQLLIIVASWRQSIVS